MDSITMWILERTRQYLGKRFSHVIEKRALEIARGKHDFKNALGYQRPMHLELYKSQGNEFKVELIENLEDGSITFL